MLSLDQVSPLIAADIVRDAVPAVAAASAFILLYLWWAFRAVHEPWSYGMAAIAGLLHDAFAVLGLFSILGRVFDLELQSTFIVATPRLGLARAPAVGARGAAQKPQTLAPGIFRPEHRGHCVAVELGFACANG